MKPQMITETKDEVTTIEGKNVRFGDITIDELRYYVIDLTELPQSRTDSK